MHVAEEIQERIAAGEALRDCGRLDDALDAFEKLAADFPRQAIAHYKLGTVFARLKKSDEAEAAYREALRHEPDYPEANNNLGALLIADGRWAEAESLLRKALAERVDYYEAHLNAADVLQKLGRHAEALHHARRALQLGPDMPPAWERVGSILNSLGRMHETVTHMLAGEEIACGHGPYWTTRAVALQSLGRHAEADEAHARAAELASEAFLPHMNRLYFSNYMPLSREDLWQRHRSFGEWVRNLLGPAHADFSGVVPDRDRRLRVGFVSGDFRLHSVSFFVPGALDHLDRSRFRLYAYSVSYYRDDVTNDLRPLFNVWRDAAGMQHQELFDLIREDQIDILVDLSGYTDDNRMMVFARRPAPVQVSYLGYPNTTGLDTMDYRLTDGIADPAGDGDEFHAEKLWRLDRCFICYSPPEQTPEVALREGISGPVVFGSFNNRAKYSEACLSAWAEILRRVPDSRLLLKSLGGNGDVEGRQELVARFMALGIDAERIEVLARIGDKREHFAAYAGIDIALDTFPYNGTTTTCEALWMGVPVVALNGDRHAARVGASILDAVGLGDLIAASVEEYVEIAARLAADARRRRELRAGMRQRLLTSALCDRQDMGRALGEALHRMWAAYCDTRPEAAADMPPQASPAEPLRLHIGGLEVREGWKILNVMDGENVDFVGDVRDLSYFDNESCAEIYASHVLEHLSQAAILPVLNELYRLLLPGGRLYVSVPDLETLSWLFLSPKLDAAAKFQIMRMMFGGQTTPHDFHYIGLSFDFLSDMLRDAGFSDIEHVESFGLFNDTSNFRAAGHRISLNLIATR